MKILLLSDTCSEHTEKWALGLAGNGVEVGLFSFNKASYEWYDHNNITVFFEPEKKINAERTLTKLAYLKYVAILKKIIQHFKPDVLHAHYATSYGLVGALSGFHPFVISAWGTDVMKFPNKNFVAKSILRYNFSNADLICATSNTIKEYIAPVIDKDVTVIPFGIDVNKFKPTPVSPVFKEGDFVLGSIKSLEKLYNIDVLINSFYRLHEKYPQLKLLIIGEGSAGEKLKALVKKLEIEDKVMFTGRVPFSEISDYYNRISVLVNISEYESFGVSVIEAMACGKPVIVTNVGGLKEVVKDDTVGLKVEIGNVEQTAAAIERLVTDAALYQRISETARMYATTTYNWNDNLQQMLDAYKRLIAQKAEAVQKHTAAS
jgi:glycosyltransferase involved in cell wall biosynthesis